MANADLFYKSCDSTGMYCLMHISISSVIRPEAPLQAAYTNFNRGSFRHICKYIMMLRWIYSLY